MAKVGVGGGRKTNPTSVQHVPPFLPLSKTGNRIGKDREQEEEEVAARQSIGPRRRWSAYSSGPAWAYIAMLANPVDERENPQHLTVVIILGSEQVVFGDVFCCQLGDMACTEGCCLSNISTRIRSIHIWLRCGASNHLEKGEEWTLCNPPPSSSSASSMPCGAIHKGRPHQGGRGLKNLQILWTNSTDRLREMRTREREGVQKSLIFADVLVECVKECTKSPHLA